MAISLGRVCDLVRYPVKSMAGVPTDSAHLGWHGLDGDRRYALRRIGDDSGFPWLQASRFAHLVLYHPIGHDDSSTEPLPTHVRTPGGEELELRSRALQTEISERSGIGVEVMRLRQGVFDDASVSVINASTISGIGREAGEPELDRRRFRANIVLDNGPADTFLEDEWIGGTLVFGEGEQCAAVSVTMRDLRCVMLNIDPDTGGQDPHIMKSVVRLNGNNAGVYGTVVQTGNIFVGQQVTLIPRARR